MNHTISIDLLKAVLTSSNLPTLFHGRATHEPALKLVARVVRHTENDDLIQAIVRAALPAGYTGDTLNELPGMITSAREKFSNAEEEDKEADGPSRALLLVSAVCEQAKLIHGPSHSAFIRVPTSDGGNLTYPLLSRMSRFFIRSVWMALEPDRSLPKNLFEEALQILEMRAVHEHPEEKVFRRVGALGDAVYVDLGDSSGRCVEINADGWRIIPASPVAFVREVGMLALPTPEVGGDLETLRSMLSISPYNWPLFVGFLLNCLRGKPPFMCLTVEGQQGSGKSFLCDIVKRIIDPNVASKIRLSANEVDLQIQANGYYLLIFDNASGMSGDISDALCTLATGGAMAKRRLYSDDELSVIAVGRPFVINGIGEFINRPDLMERAIPLQLEALGQRRLESDLLAEFERDLPKILGALYDGVSMALRDENRTEPPSTIRMIDVARWITAAEPAIGFELGTFVATLRGAQEEISVDRVNNEPLVVQMHALLKDGPFLGHISDLFAKVGADQHRPKGLPQNPTQLSKTLKRLKPSLATTGINIAFEGRTRLGRRIRVWLDDQDPQAAKELRQIPGQY